MKQELEDVQAFMAASRQSVRKKPAVAPTAEAQLRLSLLAEEISEYAQAAAAQDLTEIADALVDVIYVALGSAHAYGLGTVFGKLWDEVHRSNMAKAFPDGEFKVNEAGKTIKPEGWSPPDLAAIIEEAGQTKFRKY